MKTEEILKANRKADKTEKDPAPKRAGRPRKGVGRRVHVAGRVDEFALQVINQQGGIQKFIDEAVAAFQNNPANKKAILKLQREGEQAE